MTPNYYAVIPADVRYAKIPDGAKLLYGEITALSNKEGYCWASNKHFAELYGVGKNTISAWVTHLTKLGVIKVQVFDRNSRHIYINNKGGDTEKSVGGYRKIVRGDTEKSVHNNKENNKENIDSIESPFLIVKDEDIKKPKVRKESDPAWGLYMRCVALLSKDADFEVVTSAWDLTAVKKALAQFNDEKHVMYLVEELIADGTAQDKGFSLSKMLSASALNKYKYENNV